MNHRPLIMLGATALVGLLAACGSSGSNSSSAPSGETTVVATATSTGAPAPSTAGASSSPFVEQANAICATFTNDVTSLAQPPGTELPAIADYLSQAAGLLSHEVDGLKAISPPPAQAAQWTTFMGQLDAQMAKLTALTARMQAGDATAYEEFTTDDSSAAINAQFDALGMTTCGSGG